MAIYLYDGLAARKIFVPFGSTCLNEIVDAANNGFSEFISSKGQASGGYLFHLSIFCAHEKAKEIIEKFDEIARQRGERAIIAYNFFQESQPP